MHDLRTPSRRLTGAAVLVCVAALASGCAAVVTCESTVPNASWTGPYKGVDNNLSAHDIGRDMVCAERFKKAKYPAGFVTIFGSSRIGEKSRASDPAVAKANDELYADVMAFAEAWTRKHGKRLPIMTGAGPGLMEAGSRGAMQGGGPSIGYSTYYDPPPRGDAHEVFATWNGQPLITDGLIFSSVATREFAMILHAAAMIVAPGGTGTEWETFQIIESIKSGQLTEVPVVLLGNRDAHWKSFYARIDDMVRRGTVRLEEVTKVVVHVERASDVVPLLERRLALP
jgi:predicted Rossmann-fold nucleotide-binding protein